MMIVNAARVWLLWNRKLSWIHLSCFRLALSSNSMLPHLENVYRDFICFSNTDIHKIGQNEYNSGNCAVKWLPIYIRYMYALYGYGSTKARPVWLDQDHIIMFYMDPENMWILTKLGNWKIISKWFLHKCIIHPGSCSTAFQCLLKYNDADPVSAFMYNTQFSNFVSVLVLWKTT